MMSIQHLNVIKVYHMELTSQFLFIAIERTLSDLAEILKIVKVFQQESEIQRIILMIANGLNELSKRKMSHGDIRPQNL